MTVAYDSNLTALSNLILECEIHIKTTCRPCDEVWLDEANYGLGFGKHENRWQLLLGTPDDYRPLSMCSIVEKAEWAPLIPQLPFVIELNRRDFVAEVDLVVIGLNKFLGKE